MSVPATIGQASGAISMDLFNDPIAFEHGQRAAKLLSTSKLIPNHFRGNIADCFIALQIARRLNEEPLTVCQQLYIINGKPGWTTSYMISRANRSGVFIGPITWRSTGTGESLVVTAEATITATGKEVSVSADMHMAKAEGWTKNEKYRSMPEHMLRWRSAAMLIRLFSPEIMIGLPVIEEVETMPIKDVTPPKGTTNSLDAFVDGVAMARLAQSVDPETGETLSDEMAAAAHASTAAMNTGTGADSAPAPQAASDDAAPLASSHKAAADGAGAG